MTGSPTSRRRFLKIASRVAALGAVAIAADSILIEPNRPRVVRLDVPLRRLPAEFDGFTIVQLSDFHFDPYFSIRPIKSAVQITNDLNPDLVVLTGDFVTHSSLGGRGPTKHVIRQIEPCAEILSQIRGRNGVWAVLGNHDVFSAPLYVERSLRQVGLQVLRNTAVPIERDGKRFWLAGLDDVLGGGANLQLTIAHVPADEAVVLLAHEPDFADHAARYPVDLQLSGHSHGGQVRFPLLGAVYLPELGRKYPWGLRQVGGLTLYTNPGIGTLLIPVRWNCPPEVTVLTLRSRASART